MKLKDKVAIVTGGASGIGAASARLFAAEGARLALVDQDKVGLGQVAADPLARFIGHNPTIVMLALGFLLMIGATLLADGVGVHVPKGYIYAAMAFSALIEGLNMMARRRKRKK